ncbi:hypothetical protein BDW62DRAFT_178666 [Aspergillus aurantiobrunneus]
MISTMSTAHRLYLHLATTVPSSPWASAALIFLFSLPPLLLARYHRRYPLWLSLLLLTSPALEFPLIFALHPVTLTYASDLTSPPSPGQLALQAAVFFLVEASCRHSLLPAVISGTAARENDEDDEQFTAAITLDFATPRIALMLGVAVIGIPCRMTRRLGALHPLGMAAWVVVDQNICALIRCSERY